MDLYFLKFNSYYNRTIKFYNNLQGYQENGEILGDPLTNCSFNPNDSTDTTQVVNRKQEEIGDYLLAMIGGQIVSRWFIMEARRERTGQYTLLLRRDLFADSYTDVIKAPAFIEKATLDNDDPMIFNKEDMTFNQIKSSEHLLMDETGSGWVVGYIPRDAFSNNQGTEISGSINIQQSADISIDDLQNWEYYDYLSNKFNGAYDKGKTIFAGYVKMTPTLVNPPYYQEYPYMQGFAIRSSGVTAENLVNGYTGSSSEVGKIEGLRSPSISSDGLVFSQQYNIEDAQNYANNIKSQAILGWKNNIATINSLSLSYTNCKTDSEEYYFENLKNKIIFEESSGLFNRIVINKEYVTKTIDITTGNLFDELSNSLSRTISNIGTITENPNQNSFKLKYSYYEYTMSLEQIYITAKTTLNSDRYHLDDQPYDMFCMPYSDYLTIYKNGQRLFKSNKSLSVNMAIQIGAVTGSSNIYDIQLLPYCPVRYCIKADGSFDIGDAKVNYITDSDGNNIGVILWAISSAFTFNIPYNINILNPKIESQTDIYRLCSPNFNGQFEFSPAMNGGVNYFNVDCNYKPFNPYIHINPNFKYLYGLDFNDSRGLICGGDFSLPQLSNAWANYQLNNKNYQNIFDRQIENMEVNNAIQRKKEILGVGLGMIGGVAGGAMAGAKGGPVGIASGVVVGGIGSALAGGIDVMLNERSRIEALDYTKDQFGYQLGNIQAIPTSLSKTSALTYNNKIFPVLEYYTCTEEERKALENKLKYNGMTVMRIGTIQEFIRETPTYIKGKLIRLENTGEDFHYVSELAQEFDKGVFI